MWCTNTLPSIQVLARVVCLAQYTLTTLERAITHPNQIIKPSTIFKTSKEGYHLVVQLKPDMISNSMAQEFPSPFCEFTKPFFKLPLAGQDLRKEALDKLRVSLFKKIF